MNDCIFCKIVAGDIPSYKIWEDDNHIAFLDIYPERKGMAVLIPKKHVTSYLVEVEDAILANAMQAAKRVGKIMDQRLENNVRTTYLVEGLDVNHFHIKLMPFYEENYSKDNFQQANAKDLEEIHKKIVS